MRMLVNPFYREDGTRYPDSTIAPTALSHFVAAQQYSVPTLRPFFTILKTKFNSSTAYSAVTQFNVGTPPAPATVTNYTYGTPQSTYQSLVGQHRTLACAVRARVTALPTSTFVPSGTIYFLQLGEQEMGLNPSPLPGQDTFRNICVNGEPEAIRAVLAGKGFYMTVAELYGGGLSQGAHIPFLPSGPNNFLMTDIDSYVSTWAGNNGPWALSSAAVTSDVIATPGNNLVIFVFGAQVGMEFKFDYTHHVEYIPSSGASGLVETRMDTPSHAVRNSIDQGVNEITKSLVGATSKPEVDIVIGTGGRSFGGGSAASMADELWSGTPDGFRSKLISTAAKSGIASVTPIVSGMVRDRYGSTAGSLFTTIVDSLLSRL